MNARDRIITALTKGTPFNTNGLTWRSVDMLAQFAGMDPEETLDLLAGDLADLVAVRPSKTNKGLLAALKAEIPQAADPGDDVQVAVAGGPAFNAPIEEAVKDDGEEEDPGAIALQQGEDDEDDEDDEEAGEVPEGMNPNEPVMD